LELFAIDPNCPPLIGERVQLEPLVEAHAVDIFVLFGDPEIWTYLDSGPPDTQEALAAVYTESVLIGFVQQPFFRILGP